MHVSSLLVVLAVSPALGGEARLEVLAPPPAEAVSCRYEGVFPGSGANGQWRVETPGDGTWTLDLQRVQMAGLVGAWTQRALDPIQWTVLGTEQARRPTATRFDRTTVTVRDEAGAEGTLDVTSRLETTCVGAPPTVGVGDRWSCFERGTDSWTLSGAVGTDSGTARHEAGLDYEIVGSEIVEGPSGPLPTLHVVTTSEDGPEVHTWIDATAPWCPIRVERRRLGRVVGTDRLVERTRPEPNVEAIADEQPPVWPWLALGCVVGLMALGARVRWKKTKASDRPTRP